MGGENGGTGRARANAHPPNYAPLLASLLVPIEIAPEEGIELRWAFRGEVRSHINLTASRCTRRIELDHVVVYAMHRPLKRLVDTNRTINVAPRIAIEPFIDRVRPVSQLHEFA